MLDSCELCAISQVLHVYAEPAPIAKFVLSEVSRLIKFSDLLYY